MLSKPLRWLRFYTLLTALLIMPTEGLAVDASQINGSVVFDSNRTGSFGIYSVNLDGSVLQAVVDSPLHEYYPDPSPDGRFIVYSRSQSMDRHAPSSIWFVERDGKNPRQLVKNGTFPTFSSDGKTVFFERKRSAVMSVKFQEGQVSKRSKVKKLFPLKKHHYKGRAVVKPRVSPNGRYISFTSDIPERWNSWYVDLETGETFRVGKGCSASWYATPDLITYVTSFGAKAGSGIFRFDRLTKQAEPLQDDEDPFGHEYFPQPLLRDRYLLFGACPGKQHDHLTSNYQLFLRDLPSGQTLRITKDGFTNRWPKLLPPRG